MKLLVDLTVPEGADPIAVADAVMELLCDWPEDIGYPCPYDSCDSVDPEPWPAGA